MFAKPAHGRAFGRLAAHAAVRICRGFVRIFAEGRQMGRSADRNARSGEGRTPGGDRAGGAGARAAFPDSSSPTPRGSASRPWRRPCQAAVPSHSRPWSALSRRWAWPCERSRRAPHRPEARRPGGGAGARRARQLRARGRVLDRRASYLTIRPSFGDKGSVYAYRTEIAWDAARSSLVFRESERVDAAFAQQGLVSVPSFSGHIYLATNEHGQYRLIVVARPSIDREMHGILTTLQVGRGAHLIPVATRSPSFL